MEPDPIIPLQLVAFAVAMPAGHLTRYPHLRTSAPARICGGEATDPFAAPKKEILIIGTQITQIARILTDIYSLRKST